MMLFFGDALRPVVVEVEEDDLAAAVSGLFSPLLLGGQRQAGARPSDIEIERRGADFVVRGLHDLRGPRRFRNWSRALSVIELRLATLLLERQDDATLLHAAGWCAPGGVVLATGLSGAGKSSLALAASIRGMPLLADDCVLVRSDGWVQGVPRLVKVDARQLRIHGLRRHDTVAPHPSEAEHWWDPAASGGWSREWAQPRVVAHVAFEADLRGVRATVLKPQEGLRVLLDGVMSGGVTPSASLDRLLAVARSTLCVDLRFGAVDDGLDALVAFLHQTDE